MRELAPDPTGQVKPSTVDGLPRGYLYRVTHYADLILERAFADRFHDLQAALECFDPTLDELIAGGGNQTPFVKRFGGSLIKHSSKAWEKRMITVQKRIGFDKETKEVSRGRSHWIDIFGVGSLSRPFPGIAVEMEWNNKDPFFDRDLIRFRALHREDAIAVGVIVTRGPELQALIKEVIRNKSGLGQSKYSASTTHWDKLMQRMALGGGGECPLLLVGIQPERICGIERAYRSRDARAEANRVEPNERRALRIEAYNLLQPSGP